MSCSFTNEAYKSQVESVESVNFLSIKPQIKKPCRKAVERGGLPVYCTPARGILFIITYFSGNCNKRRNLFFPPSLPPVCSRLFMAVCKQFLRTHGECPARNAPRTARCGQQITARARLPHTPAATTALLFKFKPHKVAGALALIPEIQRIHALRFFERRAENARSTLTLHADAGKLGPAVAYNKFDAGGISGDWSCQGKNGCIPQEKAIGY